MPEQATSLQGIYFYIEPSAEIYQNLLGYKPENTNLEILDDKQWNSFTNQFGFNGNSSGIYLPRNQTAIVPSEIETAPLSLFHEYFGHGLYCEQSLAGMKLVELEKKLLEEEKAEFEGKRFTFDEINEFRKANKTAQQLREFREQNLGIYESFAVFSEYFLSREFSIGEMFEQKYDSFSKQDKEGIDSIVNFNKTWGDLATFYGFGLRKVQDEKRLKLLSRDLFPNRLERIRLITHLGSGKPFSDVDLFVASNDINSFYTDNWFDIRAYTLRSVEEKIKILDPMVTDPIMIGKFVSGDKIYFDGLKQKILSQPITGEAIRFNLNEYKREMRRVEDKSIGEHLREKIWRSAKTYLTNALALRNGDKVLTFNGLVDYSHKRLSHSEKFIELKGGIE